MLEEQHPLYKEKLYFDLVGMHWIPDKKVCFCCCVPFPPILKPICSWISPPVLLYETTHAQCVRDMRGHVARLWVVFSPNLNSPKNTHSEPILGSRVSGKIWSQFRFNDELNLASEKWSIGKYEPMKNRGVLSTLKKFTGFHFAPKCSTAKEPSSAWKNSTWHHPTLKGMSHVAFPLPFLDPVVSQEIPKQTYIFHLLKQPDLCWTICTKGIDLATKRAQIQSCRIVSWSFQPLSRLAFVIRSESLEVTVFNHFKELQPQKKGQVCAELPSSTSFFGSQKGVFQ